MTYAYDNGAGDTVDRSKVAWPDGYFVAYAYDALGHMVSVTDSDGTALAARTYDNLARPATIQYPNANDNMAYSWDSDDDLLTLTDNFTGAAADVSFTNHFTPAHQIAGATISKAAYKYAPPTAGADSYGPANGLNQYTAVTPAGGSAQTIQYDTRGNLTSDGVLTLAYDPENRLVSASKSGMSASYAYDPLGRRTTKTVNGAITNFLHDGDSEIAEYDATGALLRRFVPGPAIDQPVAMVTASGTKTFFHTDKMGSVIAMSDTTGARVEGPYTYDAYGNCSASGAPCATGVPYRFTGQRLDPETGLYYYRARCYSPALGRFCQTDPIGYKDNLNWYAYVGNDPVNNSDPTGKALAIRGEDDDKKRFIDLTFTLTGVHLRDDNGNLVQVGDRDGSVGNEKTADSLQKAIASKSTVQIDAVYKDPSVSGDSFGSNKVDVSDFQRWIARNEKFGQATFAHFLTERTYNEEHGGDKGTEAFKAAHKEGLKVELSIMGATSKAVQINNKSEDISYSDKDGKSAGFMVLTINQFGNYE